MPFKITSCAKFLFFYCVLSSVFIRISPYCVDRVNFLFLIKYSNLCLHLVSVVNSFNILLFAVDVNAFDLAD